jgi:glycosyltransferase involved in cell wall biosynthesis
MAQHIEQPNGGGTIIVVPCYNEANRFNSVAFDEFLRRSGDVSLLLVDDGSTDDTPLVHERLRQRHPRRVLTLRLATNVGKAEAVRRGLQLAIRRRAEFIGYWDADLATPLDAITQFESVLRSRPELLLVMGSRVALLGRHIHRRWRRHLLGRAFATAASLVLRLPVYDTQCGAKLFRVTPATTDLFRRPFQTRWIFDVEILARFMAVVRNSSSMQADKAIFEYPLDQWHDVQGSRLKPVDFVTAAIDLAGIYWREMRKIGSASMDAARADIRHPAYGIQHPESDIQHRDAA